MSVALYSNDELRGMYRTLTAVGVEPVPAETLIRVARFANRRAFMYQYSEIVPDDNLFLGHNASVYIPVPDWTVGAWLQNLLYNTVANDGTCFLQDSTRNSAYELAERLKRTPIPAELLPKPEPETPKQTPRYVAAGMDRDAVCKAIKTELRRRSGRDWSVTGGRGTGYGWIRITAPPKRLLEFGYMTEQDRTELGDLLGLGKPVHVQGESVPASTEYRQEYLDRAQGIEPTKYGAPYWD